MKNFLIIITLILNTNYYPKQLNEIIVKINQSTFAVINQDKITPKTIDTKETEKIQRERLLRIT